MVSLGSEWHPVLANCSLTTTTTTTARYPYPIFELLVTWHRVLLFTFSAVLMTGSTMALKWIYGAVNGIEELKKEALNPIKLD